MTTINDRTFSDFASRHELKFVLPACKRRGLVAWLQSRCRPDRNYPGGGVYSIYYDTRRWRHLAEKVNSDFVKTKFRLRWYSDLDTGTFGDDVFLEVKKKQGSRRIKKRLKVPFHGARLAKTALSDRKLLEISSQLSLMKEFPREPLWPAFLIKYKRLRFVGPAEESRISVDYDICVPRVNPGRVKANDPSHLNVAVVEIKGSSLQLSGLLHGISYFGCRRTAFSKYAECFKKIESRIR